MLKVFAVSLILCQLFNGKTLHANEDTHNPKKRQISTEWERPGLYQPGPPPPQPTPKLSQIGKANLPTSSMAVAHDKYPNGQKCDDHNQPMNFQKVMDLLKMLYDNFVPLSPIFGHDCFKTLSSGDGNCGVEKLRGWLRRIPNRFPVPSMVIEFMEEPLIRLISVVKFIECVLTRTAWKILMVPLSMSTWLTYTDPQSYYNFICEDAQYLAGLARERSQMVDNLLG